MYDEPDAPPPDRPFDPADRAREQFDHLRMHAELAAVFEGPRKFDAAVLPGLDAEVARTVQRGMAKLEKARGPDTPFVPQPSAADAAALLDLAAERELSTNDYHVHRRPGETMVVRWLAGEQVDAFYGRLQAHFDAGLAGVREDERQQHGWKQDAKMAAYLKALDGLDADLAQRANRDVVRRGGMFALATQTADEMNIAYLCDTVMGVAPADLVGPRSAPPDDASQGDLTWFFKLFLLRGARAGVERMCCFAFLQKADDDPFGD